MLGWDSLGQEGHIYVMILNRHLYMSEGIRRLRAEGICFMEKCEEEGLSPSAFVLWCSYTIETRLMCESGSESL